MFDLDFRKSVVYQEALEEGRAEGRRDLHEEGRNEMRQEIALRLLTIGRPVEEIAYATGLKPTKIRFLKKKQGRPGMAAPGL